MNTSDMAKKLQDRHPGKFTLPEAKGLVEDVFDIVKVMLVEGQNVNVTGFGKFAVETRQSRAYRDINTGELKKSKAKRVPKFVSSEAFKEAVKPKRGRPKKTV